MYHVFQLLMTDVHKKNEKVYTESKQNSYIKVANDMPHFDLYTS